MTPEQKKAVKEIAELQNQIFIIQPIFENQYALALANRNTINGTEIVLEEAEKEIHEIINSAKVNFNINNEELIYTEQHIKKILFLLEGIDSKLLSITKQNKRIMLTELLEEDAFNIGNGMTDGLITLFRNVLGAIRSVKETRFANLSDIEQVMMLSLQENLEQQEKQEQSLYTARINSIRTLRSDRDKQIQGNFELQAIKERSLYERRMPKKEIQEEEKRRFNQDLELAMKLSLNPAKPNNENTIENARCQKLLGISYSEFQKLLNSDDNSFQVFYIIDSSNLFNQKIIGHKISTQKDSKEEFEKLQNTLDIQGNGNYTIRATNDLPLLKTKEGLKTLDKLFKTNNFDDIDLDESFEDIITFSQIVEPKVLIHKGTGLTLSKDTVEKMMQSRVVVLEGDVNRTPTLIHPVAQKEIDKHNVIDNPFLKNILDIFERKDFGVKIETPIQIQAALQPQQRRRDFLPMANAARENNQAAEPKQELNDDFFTNMKEDTVLAISLNADYTMSFIFVSQAETNGVNILKLNAPYNCKEQINIIMQALEGNNALLAQEAMKTTIDTIKQFANKNKVLINDKKIISNNELMQMRVSSPKPIPVYTTNIDIIQLIENASNNLTQSRQPGLR